MKPISISIKGLNSFVEEQTINFEKLSSQGLFGIFGPTGSGKSTVLDAITFALYGKIARETGKHSEYINTSCDTARVVFEFEVNARSSKRYKITRELKRSKKGTVQTSECKIVSLTDQEVLADKERNATDAIKKIIGLEYNDFVKTVVLPQGGFNDFLKMEGKERREILERLFNLEKYGKDLEFKIGEQVKKVELEKSTIEGELKAYGGITEDLLKEQEKILTEIGEKIKQAEVEKKISNPKWEQAKRIFSQQKELEQLEELLQKESEKEEQIKQILQEIDNARKAALLDPLIKDYTDLKNEGKSVSLQFSDLEKNHIRLSQEKETADTDYLKVERQKNEDYPQLLKRQEALNSAAFQWEEYIGYKQKLERLVRELETSDKMLQEKEERQQKLLEQKKELDHILERDKEWLKEHHISQAEKNRISDALFLFNKQRELLAEKNALSQEIAGIKSKMSELDKQIKQLDNQSQRIEQEKTHWQKEQTLFRQSPFADPMYLAQKKQEMSKKIELADQTEQKKKELDTISRLLEEIKIDQKDFDRTRQELEKRYEKKQSEYQDWMMHNASNAIRHSLHAGDTCPVCMQIVGDLRAANNENVQDFTQKLTILQQEIEEISETQKEMAKQKGSLDQREEHLKHEKQKLQEQILQSDADIHSEVLKEQIAKEERSAAEIAEKIRLCEQKLTELQKEENRIQNEKVSADATYGALSVQRDKNLLTEQKLVENLKLTNEKFYAIFDTNSTKTPIERFDEMNRVQERTEEIRLEVEKIEQQKLSVINQEEELKRQIYEIRTDMREKNTRREEWQQRKEKSAKQLEQLLGRIVDPKEEAEKTRQMVQQLTKRFEQCKKTKEEKDSAAQKVLEQKNIVGQHLKNLRESAREKQKMLYEKMEQHGIADFSKLPDQEKLEVLNEKIEVVNRYRLSDEMIRAKQDRIDEHKQFIHLKKGEIAGIRKQIGDQKISQEEFDEIALKDREINQKYEKLLGEQASEQQIYKDKQFRLEQVKELCEKEKRITDRFEMLKELKSVLGARKFVEFMAMKQLNYVTIEATRILSDITNGAYYLEVDQEGAFKIRDNKNGGVIRNVRSLSGGETFVVSLSLALALSAQIQLKGVAPLELFFLDEGFGTLDDELLEVVMDSLEKIQHDRLKIGIISHVEQLKQRIPVKLTVTPAKTGEGGSKVKIEYS